MLLARYPPAITELHFEPRSSAADSSVHGGMRGEIGEEPELSLLAPQHVVPQTCRVLGQQILFGGIKAEPGTFVDLLVELLSRPPGIPREESRSVERARLVVGAYRQVDCSDLPEHSAPTWRLDQHRSTHEPDHRAR